jgi:hypothetical protein
MNVRRARAVFVTCLVASVLVGCGGGGNEPTGGSTATAGASANSSIAVSADLPTFLREFDRVCETQVGFAGAAAYDATAGIHPVVLFYDHGDPPTLIQSSHTFPAGWTVTEDADYSNNSELEDVELVACSRRVEATPTGIMCDFEGDDGSSPSTLELTDSVHELTVYAAATGEQVGESQRLEASGTDCPMIAFIGEGDTKYLNDPTEDQYINALKALVSP